MAEERVEHDWPGRFFEDFEEGVILEHGVGRTIEAADNVWFTLVTNNNNQVHFNSEYARNGLYERRLVNSCFTLSLVTGLTVPGVSQNALANLGWDDVRLTAPVFEGDTLYARTRVLETRPSRSRPGTGIVHVETEGRNQRGETVIRFRRSILVPMRTLESMSGNTEGQRSQEATCQ